MLSKNICLYVYVYVFAYVLYKKVIKNSGFFIILYIRTDFFYKLFCQLGAPIWHHGTCILGCCIWLNFNIRSPKPRAVSSSLTTPATENPVKSMVSRGFSMFLIFVFFVRIYSKLVYFFVPLVYALVYFKACFFLNYK